MQENIETEAIINEANTIYGLENCKEVIKNYDTYIKLKDKLNFGNYNVLIKNKSKYNSVEKLVDIIYRLLTTNGIIDTNYKYFENIKLKEIESIDIEEDLIILDSEKLNFYRREIKNYYEALSNKYPNKIFIIIENEDRFRDESLDIEGVTWIMEIEQISKENKKDYIEKTLKKQNIKLDKKSTFLEMLSDEPYSKVKSELLNIMVECKSNNIDKISDNILLNKLNSKYYKKPLETHRNNKKSGIQQLDNLIGLEDVKAQIKQIINYIKVSKNRGKLPMLHMCFLGNPGCGKTEVARLVGKIFEEENILSDKNRFIEAQRSDLIAKYVGQTAIKTKEAITRAKGGVLFIDEAYTLGGYISDEAGRDYGAECIATLIKEMEDNRDNLCVILAGYTQEMEHLLQTNSGFESRIQFKINFKDYTEDELYEIFKKMAREDKYKISSNLKSILLEYFRTEKLNANFSNGRLVRNLFEKIKFEQAERISNSSGDDINLIKKVDVQKAIKKSQDNIRVKKKIGF